jgi:hypothetical protein
LAADKQSLTDGKNSIATVLNDHVDEFMKEFGLPKTQKKQFKAVLAQVFGTHVQVQHKKSGLAIRGPRWSLLLILGLLITILVCLVEPTSAQPMWVLPDKVQWYVKATNPGVDWGPNSVFVPAPSQPSGPSATSAQASNVGAANQQQLMNAVNHGAVEHHIPW